MADQAEVRNVYSKDYRGVFVTDAVGGINESGYFVLDLYNDRPGYPDTYVGEVKDGRVAVDITAQEPIAVRDFQVCLYLPIPAAKRLRDFLSRQLDGAASGQ